MVEFEQCDTCGKKLSIENSEDFFVETERGSFVFCEDCWNEFEAKKNGK